jgi:hypothetical protein
MKRLFAALILVGMLAASTGGAALADTSPNGPGQPGAPNTTCSTFTTTPGNSANANSPFNANGNAGLHYAGNPGTSSLAHANSTKAVSQYDIACFQQTTHG